MDRTKGLYRKYKVRRIGGLKTRLKHRKCRFFVLDSQHDPFAVDALLAYANACEAQFPLLAADLRILAGVG